MSTEKSPFDIWDFEGWALAQIEHYKRIADLRDPLDDYHDDGYQNRRERAAKQAALWGDVYTRIAARDSRGLYGIVELDMHTCDEAAILCAAAECNYDVGQWSRSTGVRLREVFIPPKRRAEQATSPRGYDDTDVEVVFVGSGAPVSGDPSVPEWGIVRGHDGDVEVVLHPDNTPAQALEMVALGLGLTGRVSMADIMRAIWKVSLVTGTPTLPDGWERLSDDNDGPRLAGPDGEKIELSGTSLWVCDGDDHVGVNIVAVRAFLRLLDQPQDHPAQDAKPWLPPGVVVYLAGEREPSSQAVQEASIVIEVDPSGGDLRVLKNRRGPVSGLTFWRATEKAGRLAPVTTALRDSIVYLLHRLGWDGYMPTVDVISGMDDDQLKHLVRDIESEANGAPTGRAMFEREQYREDAIVLHKIDAILEQREVSPDVPMPPNPELRTGLLGVLPRVQALVEGARAMATALGKSASRGSPSGPGWWWARINGQWVVVRVFEDISDELRVAHPEIDHRRLIDDFKVDVWGPRLTEPISE